jgi:hypothetical protein
MAELRDAVKKFSSDLAKKVEGFIADVENLEVNTYTTTTDGQEVLRAHTSVSFDGDMTVKVPLGEASEINTPLWELHQAMVQQAMINRAEMIAAVGEAAASALRALGIASE